MTPTASTQLDTNLRNFLTKATLDDCRDRAAQCSSNDADLRLAAAQSFRQQSHGV
jgi:hypothetical protein